MVISPDGSIKHEQYWEFDYPDKVSLTQSQPVSIG